MEQNREARNRHTQICPTDFWQRCKSDSMEVVQSFQHLVLEHLDIDRQTYEPQPKFQTLYKNGLKMDYGLKYKM